MIDIDIAGKLFPNPLTVLVQLCSTAILFYFVYKYLWGPARAMLAKRADYSQEALSKADTLKAEAISMQKQAHEELKGASLRAQSMVESAKAEGSQVKENIISEATLQANKKMDAARVEIEYEKTAMRKQVTNEIIEVALAATEKLMGEKVNDEKDQKEIERFVSEIHQTKESK